MVSRSKRYAFCIAALSIHFLFLKTPLRWHQQDLGTKVADRVLYDFKTPPYFDWGEGVLMAGMMKAYRTTGNTKFLNFVEDFAEYWHKTGVDELLRSGKRPNRPKYCGHWGPGFAMMMLYQTNRNTHALALAQKVSQFILTNAERTREGGLCHFGGKKQLWIDTVYMCCPLLNEMAKLSGNDKFQTEATHQLKIHIKHLQDQESGLFVHMWDEETGDCTTDYWGRGSGWAAMALAEVLKDLGPSSQDYPLLHASFKRLLSSILKYQDETTGLWHTILDDPKTYRESSASAMFLYSLLLNREHGIVELQCEAAIQKAWVGLAGLVQEDGVFSGVSEGTDPSDKGQYTARKIGTYTWGTGAFLLAVSEYSKHP